MQHKASSRGTSNVTVKLCCPHVSHLGLINSENAALWNTRWFSDRICSGMRHSEKGEKRQWNTRRIFWWRVKNVQCVSYVVVRFIKTLLMKRDWGRKREQIVGYVVMKGLWDLSGNEVLVLECFESRRPWSQGRWELLRNLLTFGMAMEYCENEWVREAWFDEVVLFVRFTLKPARRTWEGNPEGLY